MNINSNYTIRLGNRNIVKIMKGSTVIWEKSTTPVVTPDYLYIQNTYAGTNDITFTKPDDENTKTLEYSKDLSNWTSFTPKYDTTYKVTLNQGEKLYLRGSNGTRPNLEIWGQRNHIAGGNVNTLLDYTNPNGVSLPQKAFKSLFGGDLYLTDASNLVLPATRLSNYCYSYMFYTCSSLTTTPTLSATTLAPHCYDNMFGGCSSLTTAPALPATTLAENCYGDMFRSCSSLTTAPTLPATTLAKNCYSAMFLGCSSLTTAPALPATTLAESCYSTMFVDCTSLTTAPELPTTTLVNFCYSHMFRGCTSLNSVTTYANDISAIYCINSWLTNVASTGTFNNNGSATYTKNSASGIPTGWTEVKPSTGPNYFYLENVDSNSGNVIMRLSRRPDPNTSISSIEYSKDKENWTKVSLSSGNNTLTTLNVGEKLFLRNDNGFFSYSNSILVDFKPTDFDFNVGGSLHTLLDYTDENVSLPSLNSVFKTMFVFSNVIDASNLIIPWTTITSASCFEQMFYSCQKLIAAPELPATTFTNSSVYTYMFKNCTSLTTAPALPATTITYGSYEEMFCGCTSLNEITVYANDISARRCIYNWLSGVAATGTFHNLGSASYPSGASGIPQGWTEVRS